MGKASSKKYNFKISGTQIIEGAKPDRANAMQIDNLVAPCATWFTRIETRCTKECCGIASLGLSIEEIRKAIPDNHRLEAKGAIDSLIDHIAKLEEHSVQSGILCDVVERHTFMKVLQRISHGLSDDAI